jgi:toxin ParE1/3/4
VEYNILVLKSAKQDIEEIFEYMADTISIQKAEQFISKVEEKISTLSQMPNRGHTPPELNRISIQEYQEIHIQPYRIIYYVMGKNAFIIAVLDSKRDIQDVLELRLYR